MRRSRDPGTEAETIFQVARGLVVAELQIITYQEHLPAMLGPDAIAPYHGYDAKIHNEFSAVSAGP